MQQECKEEFKLEYKVSDGIKIKDLLSMVENLPNKDDIVSGTLVISSKNKNDNDPQLLLG